MWVETLNLNVELNRQLGVLPNLYQADFSWVLWVTSDVTGGDLFNRFGN